MSLQEAEAHRAGFFRKYPILWQWMRTHADRCQREGRIAIGCGRVIEAAWERHESRGKYGLRYTLCCNAPVQGACADAMMRAVIAVHAALPGALVMVVHDELVCEVPEDEAEHAAEVLQGCMIEAFAATFPGAPLDGLIETKAGRNWADVH